VWTCARAFDCLLLLPKNVLNFLGFFPRLKIDFTFLGLSFLLKSFLSPEIFLSFKREKDKQNIRPSVNDDFTQIKCGPRANSRSMKHDIYLDCYVCVCVCVCLFALDQSFDIVIIYIIPPPSMNWPFFERRFFPTVLVLPSHSHLGAQLPKNKWAVEIKWRNSYIRKSLRKEPTLITTPFSIASRHKKVVWNWKSKIFVFQKNKIQRNARLFKPESCDCRFPIIKVSTHPWVGIKSSMALSLPPNLFPSIYPSTANILLQSFFFSFSFCFFWRITVVSIVEPIRVIQVGLLLNYFSLVVYFNWDSAAGLGGKESRAKKLVGLFPLITLTATGCMDYYNREPAYNT
jgi:hypothetical protein